MVSEVHCSGQHSVSRNSGHAVQLTALTCVAPFRSCACRCCPTQTPSPLSLHDAAWSSPFRFRELWDAEAGELRLAPSDAHAPSSATATATAATAAQAAAPNVTVQANMAAARRNAMNELFFGIASNTPWQQQQVRGLFAVYKQICLATEERGTTAPRQTQRRQLCTVDVELHSHLSRSL